VRVSEYACACVRLLFLLCARATACLCCLFFDLASPQAHSIPVRESKGLEGLIPTSRVEKPQTGLVAVADVGEGVLLEKPVAPGLCDTVKQYAGYFNVTTATKKYFYWFFESRGGVEESTPLVLWMTGGPGCSSGIALFNENGTNSQSTLR